MRERPHWRSCCWPRLHTSTSTGNHWKRGTPIPSWYAGACPGLSSTSPWLGSRIPWRRCWLRRQEHGSIPSARALAGSRPGPRSPGRRLLIETFGSPLSPLNEAELQIALIQALAVRCVLVCSSAVGAIGRTLQCITALAVHGVRPVAVVLMGPPDPFAVEQIGRHWPQAAAFSLSLPAAWDAEGVSRAAREQSDVLTALNRLTSRPAASAVFPIAEILERDQRSVWHPYTSLRDPASPLVAVGAEEEFLDLADGRRVIDGISSWWTILHGHRHPVLMSALHEAARSLDHVHFAGVTHPAAVTLAELLLSTAPWTGGRVFYSDNGSTAVEVALKMAYQYWCHQNEPERTWFVGLEGGYHGDTFGAMSVSRDPLFFGRFEPLLFQAEMIPPSAELLDGVLARKAGKVAAVIVEPLVQGAGGMRTHSAEELGQLAAVAKRHGVLFIADEAMTGGGRTGRLWAHQAAGIAP